MEQSIEIGRVDWTQVLYVLTLGCIALCMAMEAIFPRRSMNESLLWRWANNFSLSLVTWYIGVVASTLAVLYLVPLLSTPGGGLLPALGAGPILSFVVLLVAVQFVNYLFHLAFHKFPPLWALHSVHHADVELDVSSSYRHHPFEQLVSLPVFIPLVLLLGASAQVAVTYKLVEITLTLMTHSNLKLPAGLDRVLRRFVVTPDFHRLHHCSEKRFTNSNYGGIVPWFDYLFGTASDRPYAEQESMELGLEYRRQPVDTRLDKMLLAPFMPGRKEPETKEAEPGRNQAGLS